MASHNSRINVGFVLHVMQVAGAEVLVAETIRQLRAKVRSTIFCLDAIGSIGEKLQSEGIKVICLNRKSGRDWGLGKRLADAANAENIHVMHAHQYTPFFYAAYARIICKTDYRLIFTEHGRHFPDHVSMLRRNVNHFLLSRYVDAVNACCHFSAEALVKNDGFRRNTIDVIENGIEFQRYQSPIPKLELKQKLGFTSDKRYIACIARFHPIKDHATLIKAFALIAKEFSDVDLLLVGDGSGRNSLMQFCSELNLGDKVQFLGIRSDIAEILQAVDIFALTSLCEAASLTILEAMASGLPVVVTDVGGNPEMVREDIDGYLAPRQDAHAIAQAFRKLLNHPTTAEKMGEAGRQRVLQNYTISRTINRYHQLYRELADTAPGFDSASCTHNFL